MKKIKSKLFCKIANHNIKQDIAAIIHLPLIQRLTHHKARKPILAVGISCCVMVFASACAKHADYISHQLFYGYVNHIFIDAVAYATHGIGLIPIAKYVEPLWMIITGEVIDV